MTKPNTNPRRVAKQPQPSARTRPHVTMKYMTQFQCLGDACEDTCCAGWSVFLSEKDYKRLKQAASTSRPHRERFRESIRRVKAAPEERHSARFAIIQMRNEDHHCQWLKDGWCGIHGTFGEKALPDVCAIYPRMLSETAERKETAGYVSCPESARLMLLQPDSSELVSGTAELTTRRLPIQILHPRESRPYYAALDSVRTFLLEIWSLEALSHVDKYFLASLFASRVDSVFHQEATASCDEKLRAEMDRLLQPASIQQGLDFIRAQLPKPAFSVTIVSEVLAMVATLSRSPRYESLVQDVFDNYVERTHQTPVQPADHANPLTVNVNAIVAEYANQIGRIRALAGDRLELIFTNFARYFTFAHWYSSSKNLTAYLQRQLLERALVLFLLAGHRKLAVLLDELVGPAAEFVPGTFSDELIAQARTAVDAAAIEVFYQTARSFEHGSDMMEKLGDKLRAAGYESLAGCVFLMKF